MAGWASHQELVRLELIQSLEEGKSPQAISELRSRRESALSDEDKLEAIHRELLALPVIEDFPYQEPDDLGQIQELRPVDRPGNKRIPPRGELEDRMHGAWLGRCIGCALGKPVESWMIQQNDLSTWERQKRFLSAISPDEWPLRDYFPQHSPAESSVGKTGSPLSTREGISHMESDDDIRYTVTGQIILSQHGLDFLSVHVARAWLDWLGYSRVCTAECAAYRNLVIGYDIQYGYFSPERSRRAEAEIDWDWVATHLNPYREWIGAQIRADSYGYAAPGRPELAAELAWRDARISHRKNGIYGSMFVAAMIATAFTTQDVHEIVAAGLLQIPENCRLTHAIKDTIQICAEYEFNHRSFEDVFRKLHAKFSSLNAVHTINNAAVCTAAILLSRGDFEKAVTIAVMGGWDTDCNGATVGSIVGAMRGATGIPEFWSSRLNDRLESLIAEYHPIHISECARRSIDIAKAVEARAR